MKQEINRSHRIKVIAAICAVIVLAGSTAGIHAFRTNSHAQAAPSNIAEVSASVPADNGVISAGGTITSSQLTDSLGLQGTAVQLTVEKVLAEAGDTVTAGTPLYQVTSDSLAKAEKTLRSELQSAKSALLEQKMTYQTDKNKASLLYESELLLGNTAQTEYENDMTSLDSDLKKAYDSYQEALDTINNTPSEISAKQAELNDKQAAVNDLQEKKDSLQQELNEAKSAYTSATDSYNDMVSEYNAAAGAVRYLGNALGKDTSDIGLAKNVSASLKEQNNVASNKGAERPQMESESQSFDMTEMKMPT